MKQLGNLLLVDDDLQVLASMADWLRDQGYAVDAVASLAEGRAAVPMSPGQEAGLAGRCGSPPSI